MSELLSKLSSGAAKRPSRKRLGRGSGSGLGKTSGKGHKGAKARAGATSTVGFEGGQMPMQRRLPKRGFINPFKKEYDIINLSDIDRFPEGTILEPKCLVDEGLARKGRWIKVLGKGQVQHAITVIAHAFSSTAKTKIEKAGGKVVLARGA